MIGFQGHHPFNQVGHSQFNGNFMHGNQQFNGGFQETPYGNMGFHRHWHNPHPFNSGFQNMQGSQQIFCGYQGPNPMPYGQQP